MASVTFSASVGGDGSTVTDDSNETTGLANYGYTTRLVPAFSNIVNVASYTGAQATAAAASASAAAGSANSALNAPGTNASQTGGSVTIGTGSKTITIQSGKAYAIGQTLVAASAANPANFMAGQVTAYSGTSLTLNVAQTGGSGSMTDLVISMGAIVSSTLPSQTGNAGKFLTTDGTTASWNSSALAVANGGTGATTASGARGNLGLAIGTDVQAYNANLAALAGLGLAADKMIFATGAGTLALQTLTGFARTLLDDADAATARATLGLTIGSNVQAFDAELAAIAGLTSAADRLPYFTGSGTAALATFTSFARTLADDADAAAARGTLGAAASGSNSDITSLTGLTTPLSIGQGGTGASDAAGIRAASIGAAGARWGRIVCNWNGVSLTTVTFGEALSVSRFSTGNYRVSLPTAATSTSMIGFMGASGSSSAAGSGNVAICTESESTARTTSTVDFFFNNNGNSKVDPQWFTVDVIWK